MGRIMTQRVHALRERLGTTLGAVGRRLRHGDPGQGTTEYAILVGVLVVVAIAAIILLRPMIETLWNSIVDGIGQLS